MFALNRKFPFFRKLVIVVFSFPLMFAGGSFLGGLAQNQSVGEVGSIDIPRSEFTSRLNYNLEEYRRRSGVEEIPPDVSERIVQQVQQDLLSFYLFRLSMEKKGIDAPGKAVAEQISRNSEFQDDDGDFSLSLYLDTITDRQYYEDQVKRSIGQQWLLRSINPIPLPDIRQQMAAFRRQQRVVDEATVAATVLVTADINVTREDIGLYYQRNRQEYAIEEEGIFEYFIFSLDDFAASLTVSEEAIQSAFEDYQQEQEDFGRRKISHILVESGTEADEIYELAATEDFEDLARTRSADAGSAATGGVLGIFAQGDLPVELDDVAFAMTVGEISEPVALDDGYSILRLDEIISDGEDSLAEVREEMVRRAKREAATEAYDEKISELSDLAPLEVGSLVNMAASVAITGILTATVRTDTGQNASPFDREEALVDVFDPIIVSDGENSQPIPFGDDGYFFVRAIAYRAEGFEPLEEVAPDIANLLRANRAAEELYRQMAIFRAKAAASLTASISTTLTVAEEPAPPVTLAASDTEATLATATVTASPPKPINERLEEIEWERRHTVILAGDADEAGLNSSSGEDDGQAFATAADEEESDQLEDETIERLFFADLSHGLPSHVFLPKEDGQLHVFRIREVRDGEPLAEDFLVIDELLSDLTERISGVGYLDALSAMYRFEFYDLPDLEVQAPEEG